MLLDHVLRMNTKKEFFNSTVSLQITNPTANVDASDRASEFVIPIIVIMMITIFNLVTIQNGYKVSLISKLIR